MLIHITFSSNYDKYIFSVIFRNTNKYLDRTFKDEQNDINLKMR